MGNSKVFSPWTFNERFDKGLVSARWFSKDVRSPTSNRWLSPDSSFTKTDRHDNSHVYWLITHKQHPGLALWTLYAKSKGYEENCCVCFLISQSPLRFHWWVYLLPLSGYETVCLCMSAHLTPPLKPRWTSFVIRMPTVQFVCSLWTKL
jgi:hypothetical protein